MAWLTCPLEKEMRAIVRNKTMRGLMLQVGKLVRKKEHAAVKHSLEEPSRIIKPNEVAKRVQPVRLIK